MIYYGMRKKYKRKTSYKIAIVESDKEKNQNMELTDGLMKCISISHYAKQHFHEKIYREKMINLYIQDN